jgi:predicted transcriptional regulator
MTDDHAPADLPQLSAAELEVMNALWEVDRLSARELHDRIADRHGWATSTTRTLLERLVVKGVVDKQPFHGLHLYRARVSRARGVAALVRDFATQVLGTSPAAVVPLFADVGSLTADELAELERLLEAGSEDRR